MNKQNAVAQFPLHRVQSASRQQQLKNLFAVTELMFEAALAGDWDTMSRLQSTRTDELITCFESPLSKLDLTENAEILVDILALNERMVDIVNRARIEAGSRLGQLNQSSKAAMSYQDIASNRS